MQDSPHEYIHISLSPWDLSDDYNRHTGTTIASVLENCSRKVIIHLLYEEKFSQQNPAGAEANIQKYHQLASEYGAEVFFHAVTLPEWVNDSDRKNLQHFTPGTLLRLYLPTLLSDDISKIIYLDCDIVVKTDLAKLWDVPLEDYSLAACIDAANKSNVRFYSDVHKPFGIDWEKYFNAGFLVMNLEKIRETRALPDIVMDIIYQHPELPYLDQDVLNIVFQNDMYFLSQRYNLPVGMRMTDYRLMKKLGISEGKFDDCILHFNGRKKPWKVYSGAVDEEYWQYFKKTPWCEDEGVFSEYYTVAREGKIGFIDWVMSQRFNLCVRTIHSIGVYLLRLLVYFSRRILR